MRSFGGAVLGIMLALCIVAWPAQAVAKGGRLVGEGAPASTRRGAVVYVAPTWATWGSSAGAPPTFAFGKPAEVLLIVPGGYVVRHELPLEQAIEHATNVSRRIGQPIAVTIADPAEGPTRVEYVDAASGERGK